MMTPLLLSSLLAGSAIAGDLEIATAVPVVVFVDGRPLTYQPGTLTVVARNLGDGDHQVIVRNVLGKQMAEMTVGVGADEEVRLSYRKKAITEIGRGQARPGAAAEDAQRQAEEAAERAARAEARAAAAAQTMASLGHVMEATAEQVEAMVDEVRDDDEDAVAAAVPPAPPAPPEPPDAGGPGSLSVAELSPLTGEVWVDGKSLKYGAGNRAFVATNLSPGQHTVRIENNGRPYHDGPMDIRPDQNTRCLLVYEGLTWVPDCHYTSPALTSVNQTIGTISAGSGSTTPAPPKKPQGMAAADFTALHAAVDDESFSSDQLAMITTAAAKNTFTVDQVGQLMDLLFADSDKVEVVRAVADRIVDPQNAALLAGHVDFSSDKETILALF